MALRIELEEDALKHYWGDAVRQLLITGAVAGMLASPFFPDLFGPGLLFNIGAVLVIVGFAALTSPYKRWVIMGDAVIAGVGVILFGGSAVLSYGPLGLAASVVALGLGLVFLSAFYFAVKTLRAMQVGQIETDESREEDLLAEREMEDERPLFTDDDESAPLEEYAPHRAHHHESFEDRAERVLSRHGGHMPVGDITDEAPREEFSD
jgi:hypothetical protein